MNTGFWNNIPKIEGIPLIYIELLAAVFVFSFLGNFVRELRRGKKLLKIEKLKLACGEKEKLIEAMEKQLAEADQQSDDGWDLNDQMFRDQMLRDLEQSQRELQQMQEQMDQMNMQMMMDQMNQQMNQQMMDQMNQQMMNQQMMDQQMMMDQMNQQMNDMNNMNMFGF